MLNGQTKTNKMDIGDTKHHSELRIVLMGHRRAGKSSTGNSILGREEFDSKRSAQCVKRHGDVADTHITVIEAPGWWRYHTVEESPELLKQELVFSVSQCPPGPHALLLIIRADYKFKETERKAVEAHVSLLGERVWSHTIVVFTCGDSLSDTSIEQHIESEGQELQRLLDKCGNRYHVLNNHNRSDDTQIKELLEKIEETVAQNNGCHFDIDRTILQEMQERRRAEKERAEERMKRMKIHRENIRSQMSDSQHLSELRIVLMGWKASGKSSTGNSILGRDEFDLKRSAQCVSRHGDVADTHITVIEAPGWWKFSDIEKSTEKQELVFSVFQCPPGPHALLLIIDVDTKVKHYMRRAVEAYVSLLGERVWSHTVVVFTHGDSLSDTSIEQHIESEGQELQRLLDKCGNRYHVLNNHNRSEDTQIKELLEKIEETVVQNNGRHFKLNRKILQEMDIKSEIKSEYNGSDSWSQRGFPNGSLISRARSFFGSLFRDTSHTYALGATKQHASNEFPQPNFADEDRRLMIESRRVQSVGLPPNIADEDRRLMIESRKCQSVGLPPNMRAHGSSIKWSQRNSAEKTFSPKIKAESGFGSSYSITSTVSSGYGSLLSISKSVEDSEYKRKNNMSMSSELREDLQE